MTNNSIETAKLITTKQYCELKNPVFEGQTKTNSNGQYKMYCSDNGLFYYTNNTL